MSKLYYDHLGKSIRPMLGKCNSNELVFENPSKKQDGKEHPGLHSQMSVETAGNVSAGRSMTIHNLHISELAMWSKAEETMLGLMQSVPENEPRTMVIIESTAKGMAGDGSYFYDMWMEACAGKNDFTPIFIAWWELKEYTMPAPKNFKLYDYDHPSYGDEEKTKESFNLTLDQMYWRRWYIKNKCKNSLNLFKQEYPATESEAFLITGRPVFDAEKIAEYINFVKTSVKAPRLGDLDSELIFTPSSMGRLKIWKEPQDKNRYSVGADPAEGLARGDPQSATVIDKINYEQVAEWHGRVTPDEFAHILKDLARYYNEGIIVPESNNPTTVSYLKDIYYRIYRRKEIGKWQDKSTKELGFRMTGKSKPLLIGGFTQLFDDDELMINSIATLREMSRFVEDVDKKMKAEGKYYDDRVISFALALEGLKEIYMNLDGGELVRTAKNPNYKRDEFTGI